MVPTTGPKSDQCNSPSQPGHHRTLNEKVVLIRGCKNILHSSAPPGSPDRAPRHCGRWRSLRPSRDSAPHLATDGGMADVRGDWVESHENPLVVSPTACGPPKDAALQRNLCLVHSGHGSLKERSQTALKRCFEAVRHRPPYRTMSQETSGANTCRQLDSSKLESGRSLPRIEGNPGTQKFSRKR